MKCICIFSAQYLPRNGGVERYTHNLIKYLLLSHYKVILVTSQTGESNNDEVIETINSQFSIYRVPTLNFAKGRLPIMRIGGAKQAINMLKTQKIDMIFIQTRLYFLSCLGAELSSKKSIPAYVIEHGTSHISVGNKIFDSISPIYEHLLVNYIKKRVDGFFGVSKASSNWLKHFHIDAKGELYNAIDIKEEMDTIHYNIKQMYKLDQDAIIVSFVGRLIEEKGILKLISACKKIDNKLKIHLLIAGDGKLERQISMEESDNIHYLGSLEHKKVLALLAQTDLFCFPTEYPEGFPTSVLEAAFLECYIITTKSGGGEIVNTDEFGKIVTNTSVESIKEEIVAAAKSMNEIKAIAKKGRNRVMENYTWEHVITRYVRIIENEQKN